MLGVQLGVYPPTLYLVKTWVLAPFATSCRDSHGGITNPLDSQGAEWEDEHHQTVTIHGGAAVATLYWDHGKFRLAGLSFQEKAVAAAFGAKPNEKGTVWRVPSPCGPEVFDAIVAAIPNLVVHPAALVERNREAARRATAALLHQMPALLPTKNDNGITLDPHQRVAVEFLKNFPRAILADDPGLGKTLSAIVTAESLHLSAPALIVAPKTLLYQWAVEIERFSNDPRTQVLTTKTALDHGAQWFLINYEAALRRLPELRPLVRGGCLIVDEAVYIKNRKAKRTDAVWKLAKEAEACFLLTGTPIPNYPEEAWSLLHCIDPERYASFWDWADQFLVQEDNGFGVTLNGVQPTRLDDFRAELLPRMLRRERSLLKLPDCTQETVMLPLDARAMKAYQAMENKFIAEQLDGDLLLAPSVLSQLIRLRQIALDPALCECPGESVKATWIREWFEDNVPSGPLPKGERPRKAVVFSPFKEFVYRLQSTLEPWGAVVVTGDQTPVEREEAKRRLNQDPNCRVLIGTDAAAGEGLNLQEQADVVIFAAKSWRPDLVEQCIARVHRRGQDRQVHVYSLICPATVDEAIEEVIADKKLAASEALAIRGIADAIVRRCREGMMVSVSH